jgi:hypothetical protein
MKQAMEGIRAGANRAVARPIQNHLLLAFVFDLLEKQPAHKKAGGIF